MFLINFLDYKKSLIKFYSKNKRINLPKPSVDTGMGLERMTAVLQGTHDNYEIDHFQKIMQASADITKTKVNSNTIASHRVIADHLRAASFLIAEGVLPSNEGRGYVLRRIMRRGMRHAHTLGCKDPVFFRLFNSLLSEMDSSYPELGRAKDLIIETLKNEEEKFSSLLVRGIKILEENILKVKNKTFKMHSLQQQTSRLQKKQKNVFRHHMGTSF